MSDNDKIISNGVYRIATKKGNHVNIKQKDDGTISAIQFTNVKNNLDGPVDLISIDEKELTKTVYINESHRSLAQIATEDIIAPVLREALQQGLDKLVDRLKVNGKYYIKGIKESFMNKETKAERILNKKITSPKIEMTEEEIENVLLLARKSAIMLVGSINLLKNAIVSNDNISEEERKKYIYDLQALYSKDAMEMINLWLDNKNSMFLDEISIRILLAFREGKFIVNDEEVPISKYLEGY